MLLPRTLTAILGAPLLLGAIYFGSLPFFFLILGIVLLGLREFYFLARESGYSLYPVVGMAGGALLTTSVFLNGVSFSQVTDNQATAALIALAVMAIVVRSLWRGPSETLFSEWGVTLFGIFYVAWMLSHLLMLRDLRPQGESATFMLFCLIWVADIVAYFVGVRWGRHLIAPSISPKKSWEGTIAGVVAAAFVGLAFQQSVLRTQLKVPEAMVLSLVTALLAFASDLGESMIKRSAGAKDSSLLLPGHGGVLDRFDSFILASPFFYYYWAFFKH